MISSSYEKHFSTFSEYIIVMLTAIVISMFSSRIDFVPFLWSRLSRRFYWTVCMLIISFCHITPKRPVFHYLRKILVLLACVHNWAMPRANFHVHNLYDRLSVIIIICYSLVQHNSEWFNRRLQKNNISFYKLYCIFIIKNPISSENGERILSQFILTKVEWLWS